MIGAFAYLLGRSARNRLARQLGRLRQPRYVVALLLGLSYLWFLVLRQTPRPAQSGALEARWVELVAALGVAGAIAWAWLFGSERRALAFTPAELTFLFPAPVTRRQLIHFKLLRNQLVILLNTAIWTFVLSRERFGASTWRHAVAVWVLLTTLSLHRLGASFVRSTLADHGLEGVRRKVISLAVLAVVLLGAAQVASDVFALVGAGSDAGIRPFFASLGLALDGPVARLLLWPFRAMSRPLTAPTTSAWLAAMGPALLLLAAHYVWVLRSDAAFEEVAAEASLRRAEKLSDARGPPARRVVRWEPAPYRLSGRGQPCGCHRVEESRGDRAHGTTPRDRRRTRGRGVVLAALSFRSEGSVAEIVGWFAAMWAGFLVVIGPQWIRSDLRGDLPKLELLRSYPLSGRSVIAGEVAASTLVVSVLQLGVLTVAYLAFLGNRVMEPGLGVRTAALAGAFVLFPVVNLLGVLIHNGAVILYPAWLGTPSGRPAGVEALGQNMLAIIAYLILLGLVLVIPAAIGASVFFALRPLLGWAAIAVGAVPGLIAALAEARLMVAWIGRAFEATDPGDGGDHKLADLTGASRLREIALRDLGDDGVGRIHDVRYAALPHLPQERIGIRTVESVLGLQPLDQLDVGEPEGIDEGSAAPRDHDVLGVHQPGPVDLLSFDYVDLEHDIHAGLEPRACDLALALARVAVAKVEVRPVVKDGQKDRGALPQLRRIHVAAEITRPDTPERFLTARCDREAAEHRLEVYLHPTHPALGHLGDTDHAGRVDAPDVAPGSDRVVQHSHPGVGRESAEIRVDLGRGQRVIGSHLHDLDLQHVLRRRALDVDRSHLARKGTPFGRVVRSEVGPAHEYRTGPHSQHRIPDGVGRLGDLRLEANGVLGRRGERNQDGEQQGGTHHRSISSSFPRDSASRVILLVHGAKVLAVHVGIDLSCREVRVA